MARGSSALIRACAGRHGTLRAWCPQHGVRMELAPGEPERLMRRQLPSSPIAGAKAAAVDLEPDPGDRHLAPRGQRAPCPLGREGHGPPRRVRSRRRPGSGPGAGDRHRRSGRSGRRRLARRADRRRSPGRSRRRRATILVSGCARFQSPQLLVTTVAWSSTTPASWSGPETRMSGERVEHRTGPQVVHHLVRARQQPGGTQHRRAHSVGDTVGQVGLSRAAQRAVGDAEAAPADRHVDHLVHLHDVLREGHRLAALRLPRTRWRRPGTSPHRGARVSAGSSSAGMQPRAARLGGRPTAGRRSARPPS